VISTYPGPFTFTGRTFPLDRPVPDSSIPVASSSLPERPKFDLPDQAIREACKVLERKIDPDDEHDLILDVVRVIVHRSLSQDPELRGAIANLELMSSGKGRKSLSSY
jgi:hypothetical protein